jgi:pyridoxine/pyridoxamine 5'-phosphate oxidase
MTPETLLAMVWDQLSAAPTTPASPLRTPTLATVAQDDTPRLRMVVLRALRTPTPTRTLIFHTDIRSAKWAELGRTPAASVLTWDPDARIQMRFEGTVERHGPGSPAATSAWSALPPHTRATYAGAAPGRVLEATPPLDAQAFGVLNFTAQRLDWLELSRTANRRFLADLATGAVQEVAP